MGKVFQFCLTLLLILILAACGSSDGSNADEDSEGTEGSGGGDVYSVGIDVTYPPFEFQENGEYKGIDIDLINAIAKNQGFEIELEAMDFSGIIPAIKAGQLDIALGGMSITDERKKEVDFSEPYFEAGLTLVVSGDNTEIASIDDLEGKTVAIKSGTTGAKWAEGNKGKYGFKTIQVPDSTSMFQEVSNGSSDALIEDYPVISYSISKEDLGLQIVGDRLNGDNYGIAVLKGKNDELLKKIDDGLASLKESGEYDKIISTYIAE